MGGCAISAVGSAHVRVETPARARRIFPGPPTGGSARHEQSEPTARRGRSRLRRAPPVLLSREGTPSNMDHSETDIPAEVAANTPSTDGPATSSVAPSPASPAVAADQGTPAPDDRSLDEGSTADGPSSNGAPRRRGSRGGQRRRGTTQSEGTQHDDAPSDALSDSRPSDDDDRNDVELPEPMSEGRASPEAAERALVRKPRIGDTMPIPTSPPPGPARAAGSAAREGGDKPGGDKKRRRRGSGGGSGAPTGDGGTSTAREFVVSQ